MVESHCLTCWFWFCRVRKADPVHRETLDPLDPAEREVHLVRQDPRALLADL